MNRVLAAALACLGLLLSGGAFAQAEWPAKPVRLIAPAAPGGNPDVLGRLLAEKLASAFGKPFIVENVPGGGGVLAAEMVANATPDGHVLFLGESGSLAINPAMNSKLAYQPLRDFAFITALAALPTVLVAHPGVPATSLTEFVALVKAQSGRLDYGSAGNGSIHHLTMALFLARAGIEMQHIPYRGGTPLVQALMNGEVKAGWSGIPNVIQAIETGALKVFGISTAQRSPSLPNVPTVAEQGFAGFDVATVLGLQAPAATPAALVARLQAAVAKAVREPDLAERMARLGMQLREDGTAAYERFVREDYQRYADAVKLVGARSE